MDLLAAYIDAELAGEDKPSNETIREIVESHGGTISASDPNVILTPDGEIRLDGVLNDASSGTDNPEEINKTIIELNKQINDLKGQLAQANTDKQNLQSQVTELTENITELNTQVASWKKKAEDGEVTISEKDTQISNLNSQITAKNSEIEEKQNKIQELEGNVTTLTNEKTTLESQVTTLNTRVAELEGKQATGDATAGDVLAGKTFSTADGVNLTGTMVNRGTLNFNPSTSESQTIEPGYYTGGNLSTEKFKSEALKHLRSKKMYIELTKVKELGNSFVYSFSVEDTLKNIIGFQFIGSGFADGMQSAWVYNSEDCRTNDHFTIGWSNGEGVGDPYFMHETVLLPNKQYYVLRENTAIPTHLLMYFDAYLDL